jgi:hypothetical protein
LGVGGFHEQTAELLEGFGVFKHLGSAFYDGSEGSFGIGAAFGCVFGILMATGSSGRFADRLRRYVAEVQVDGKPSRNIVGLDAPEGG